MTNADSVKAHGILAEYLLRSPNKGAITTSQQRGRQVRAPFSSAAACASCSDAPSLQPIKDLRVVTEDLINRRSGDLPVCFEFPQRVDLRGGIVMPVVRAYDQIVISHVF